MAFGLPASYTTQIELAGSRQGARDAIVGTFEALGWNYEMDSPDIYHVRMSLNPSSWGELLTVTLTGEGTTVVTSKCIVPLKVFDWGQNKRNVRQFVERYAIREARESKLDYKIPVYLDDQGQTPLERVIVDREPDRF
jgi:hypothetical protein